MTADIMQYKTQATEKIDRLRNEDNQMKKITALLITAVLLLTCLVGCSSDIKKTSDKLEIISLVFPSYDFARSICGDKAEITLLLPPGSEAHTYEPTVQDIVKIQNSDLFIYVGGESDTWTDKILSSVDTDVRTLKLMDCVTALEEEIKEGMEAEHDEAGHEETDEKEYDEHVWTSPVNALKISELIKSAVCELDPDNSSIYEQNYLAYASELTSLDNDFKAFFASSQNKTLVFGDRFPLRYFEEEYGLDCYAAFPGCSSESEPSAATIAFLTDKIKSENISTVYYIEFSNHSIADNLAEETGTKTAMFHTCHNVTAQELESGATYVSLMRNNLEVLRAG